MNAIPLFLLALGVQTSDPTAMTPLGRLIKPIGSHVGVGSYPVNMVLSPDARFAVVTTIGYRQFLTVVRTSDGSMVQQLPFNERPQGELRDGLYYGLAVDPKTRRLYVSRGAQDLISVFDWAENGQLTSAGDPLVNKEEGTRVQPNHIAGLALNSSGNRLYVVNNQTTHQTDYKGSLSVFDVATKKELRQIPCTGFPFGVAALTKGAHADKKVYVGGERDGVVQVIDPVGGRVMKTLKTGAGPVGLTLNGAQSRLFVANASSDTVSVIDTARDRVIDTILLRPSDLRGVPGAGPNSISLSPDESRMYVTLGDMNAVAVVDLKRREMVGMLPTGWLPTGVINTRGRLLISSAKGVQAQNPNNKPVKEWGTYIQNVIEGSVTKVAVPSDAELKRHTATVVANNFLRPGLDSAKHRDLKNPGIKYVIYVVKENRTYDNVFGKHNRGNGDPDVCLFPQEVTPNQHALADRFVLLDNFHVCAEVSQDGWLFSTAGMANPYASRNTPYNYSRRGRSYDTEGSNNGVPVDLIDIPDVSRPEGGYIWEQCRKYGVTYRNYGFFTQFIDSLDKRHDVFKEAIDNGPAKKALIGFTNDNFRRYDLEYADSELHVKQNWSWPRQRKTFGKFNSPSRFSEWHREFKEFVRKGEMPRFQMVRFGQDHTSGTQVGQPTPSAMVADNDYAVGQLVEAVSNSPFWKETAICVLEDDAQNGLDHVDAHRSIAFIISPYVKRGTLDSRFYNTDSMLRTMEILLGMPPMNQYDAIAAPIAVFDATPDNMEPYRAIEIDRAISCKVNGATAYRAKDSERISAYFEESMVDEDLNEILWHSIKGVNTPMPKFRRGLRLLKDEDDD